MLTSEEKREIVARVMATALLSGGTLEDLMLGTRRQYHSPLPPDLADWYVYTLDGGHSILVGIPAVWQRYPHEAIEDTLVPAPVKAVLRVGYSVDAEGYVWCDLPYDSTLGLMTEEGDDEY